MTASSIQLFCTDLDGTLLGNPEATRRFYESDTRRIIYRIDVEERILSWDNTKLGLA